ncbi:MAG: cyclodeaminase/cyclohydrolase family protein [Bacteroidetes bacterium]|nr:cyclodeaminase/cyclohydrolase family protein [Bacteroidota bacterium]
MDTYAEGTIRGFVDVLASSASMPGGGTAAALAGAMGAALTSMVSNLTIGREKYKDVEADMQALLPRTEALRAKLLEMMDADAASYTEMMAAYRLPRDTDEQKAARTAAIQAATIYATKVPLEMMELCAEVVKLALPVAEKGNLNAVTDAGCGALLAEAALQCAAFNIKINLRSIKDAAFAEEARLTLQCLSEQAAENKRRVLEVVDRRIGA